MVVAKCYALSGIFLALYFVLASGFYEVNQEIEELKAIYGEHVPYKPVTKDGQLFKRFLFGSSKPYCHEKLGCFPMTGDFAERPVGLAPNSRETVNTQFTLFTKANVQKGQTLRADDSHTLLNSRFKASRKTMFIIHGFLESAQASWFSPVNVELLKDGDYNVIDVDWGSLGASKTLYTQATANTRVVAREIVYLLSVLQKTHGLKLDNVHLIGHSLGAHIAGYVGKNLTASIGRITGLDPAEPYFQGYNTGIRLDPSDAKFVDIIHSDGDSILEIVKGEGGFGTSELSGHADFFPNGGEDQPNCKNGIVSNVRLENNLYEESINDCPFTGVLCSSFEDFENGKCPARCNTPDGCNSMGLHCHKPSSHGYKRYYLHTTGDDGNFCANEYSVKVTIDGGSAELQGELDVTVTGDTGKQRVLKLNEDGGALKAGKTYTYQVGLSTELGKPVGLQVVWTRNLSWWKVISKACGYVGFCTNSIKLQEIELTDINGKSYYFCGTELFLKSGVGRYLFTKSQSCVDQSMLVGK
ncbi:pancreatic lipase-related protein 2-like [Watersipora subatra]|uniref:pancreatic lipase-related protein 2-like n=1 Tax=Watersipora subatra TaxID=2589382 RepID=UPI00355BF4BC